MRATHLVPVADRLANAATANHVDSSEVENLTVVLSHWERLTGVVSGQGTAFERQAIAF
jgi:hypothetical protein